MDWLLDQAKSAGPLVAVAALIACGVLWRALMSAWRTNLSMHQETTKALLAVARNLGKINAKLDRQ